jgi:predicted SAM-dependent methyltransferase
MNTLNTKEKIKNTFIRFIWKLIPQDAVNPLITELKSYLGRTFSSPLQVNPTDNNFFNFGCGQVPLKGFINVDFYSFFGNSNLDYQTDFRHPLNVAEEVADGIFTEHMVEHLSYEEAQLFFSECHRILKVGGVLRVVCPDVSKFIAAYCDPNTHASFLRSEAPLVTTPMEALSDITQNWKHRSAWDFETMAHYLKKSGFSSVRHCSFKEGSLETLLVDLEARKVQSLYVEAVKK